MPSVFHEYPQSRRWWQSFWFWTLVAALTVAVLVAVCTGRPRPQTYDEWRQFPAGHPAQTPPAASPRDR